jgi:hypothetical protein
MVRVYHGTRILQYHMVRTGTYVHDQGSGTNPGLAAEAYAAVKVAKYADQDNFIPFILETGGRVNKADLFLPGTGTGLMFTACHQSPRYKV